MKEKRFPDGRVLPIPEYDLLEFGALSDVVDKAYTYGFFTNAEEAYGIEAILNQTNPVQQGWIEIRIDVKVRTDFKSGSQTRSFYLDGMESCVPNTRYVFDPDVSYSGITESIFGDRKIVRIAHNVIYPESIINYTGREDSKFLTYAKIKAYWESGQYKPSEFRLQATEEVEVL